MTPTDLMSISSTVAIMNSLFFGVYLIQPCKRTGANILLSILLFALALRIFKSAISVLFPDASYLFLLIGLSSMAMIGPVIFYYFKAFQNSSFQHIGFIHFVPAICMSAAVIANDQLLIYRMYQVIVFQIFVYLFLTAAHMRARYHAMRKVERKWIALLLTGIFLIWLTMVLQLIFDNLPSYILTSTVAALAIYGISFWGLNNRKLFHAGLKAEVTREQLEISRLVHKLLSADKIYQEPQLTLQKVSDRIDIPAYLISKSINSVDKKSFPELVNNYRLEAVKRSLAKPACRHISIEGIAFENGFSSLSSFYALFKKETRLTPAEYRNKFFKTK
jgi:AraC-like DNA-binding protein